MEERKEKRRKRRGKGKWHCRKSKGGKRNI